MSEFYFKRIFCENIYFVFIVSLMPKVLITTVPFADKNCLPLDLLEKSNIEYLINLFDKKLTENELTKMVTILM